MPKNTVTVGKGLAIIGILVIAALVVVTGMYLYNYGLPWKRHKEAMEVWIFRTVYNTKILGHGKKTYKEGQFIDLRVSLEIADEERKHFFDKKIFLWIMNLTKDEMSELIPVLENGKIYLDERLSYAGPSKIKGSLGSHGPGGTGSP